MVTLARLSVMDPSQSVQNDITDVRNSSPKGEGQETGRLTVTARTSPITAPNAASSPSCFQVQPTMAGRFV